MGNCLILLLLLGVFIGDYSHRWLGNGGGGACPTFLEIVFESRALANFFLTVSKPQFPHLLDFVIFLYCWNPEPRRTAVCVRAACVCARVCELALGCIFIVPPLSCLFLPQMA